MRPIAIHPRGLRRARVPNPDQFLACPRVAPDWELAALQALIKPQTRGAIEHRSAEQPWSPANVSLIQQVCEALSLPLDVSLHPHFPDDGDYWMILPMSGLPPKMVQAVAIGLSIALPKMWFSADRLHVRDGRFFRRVRGYKLWLGPASNVHLPRALRTIIRQAVNHVQKTAK